MTEVWTKEQIERMHAKADELWERLKPLNKNELKQAIKDIDALILEAEQTPLHDAGRKAKAALQLIAELVESIEEGDEIGHSMHVQCTMDQAERWEKFAEPMAKDMSAVISTQALTLSHVIISLAEEIALKNQCEQPRQ